MTDGPALEVEALEVAYAGVPAVRGIDLTVGRGEIVGLVGPNGAGKSSTLHAIVGAERISGGDARLYVQVLGLLVAAFFAYREAS